MSKTRLGHDDRINLQAAIAKGESLSQIATRLKKSRSSIYREIINNCSYRDCRHSCSHCQLICTNRSLSQFVNGRCQKFIASECYKWKKYPYSCNGCQEKQFCTSKKRYYDCVDADEMSRRKRKESRTYKSIKEDDIKTIDQIITNGVKLGQSLHHLYIANPSLKDICSERTIRRYIYHGYLSVKAHQLPRYARYSHKYDYKIKKIVNVERMLGRTYSDYQKYIEVNKNKLIWQYDSVEGKVDDRKAILTITFPECRFQFGYLITKQSCISVYRKIRLLQKLLGTKYGEIFQVNLSDNGPEFAKFHEIETNEYGHHLCKIFFTEPYRSTNKASCEKNHEFIRYVIPKGVSLNFLTQEKINLLFSHINSYVRKSNQNKTPYQLAVERFGNEFMQFVGIVKVDHKQVCLKPELIR